jgi:chaperonin cofactor prefoldin
MSILARVFVILIFITTILYVSVQATLWHHARNWREAFTLLQRDYEELSQYNQAQIRALQEVIRNREDIITQRNGVITKLQASIRAIADDLAMAVTNYATVKQDLVTLLNDHTRVLLILSTKDQIIKSLTDARDDYKARFDRALRQKDTAENQVYRYAMIKSALEKDLSDLNKNYVRVRDELNDAQVTLAYINDLGFPVNTIVVGMPAPPISAKVVGVKDSVSLVVLSVGSENGVKQGFEFTVYRGNLFVARVIVEKVLPKLCGCRIMYKKGDIKSGDEAATHLN